MDTNLGRITWSGRKRHFGGNGTCKGAPHKKEKTNMSQFERFVTHGNEKADELQEQCWTKDLWHKRERKLCSRRERRCMQHCSTRPASIAW